MKKYILLAIILLPLAAMAQRVEAYEDEHGDFYYTVYGYGLPREVVKKNSEMRASMYNGVFRRHHTTKLIEGAIDDTYIEGYNCNLKISFAYAIAPYNVDIDGEHTTSTDGLTWTQASGWDSTMDDQGASMNLYGTGEGSATAKVAETSTGCAAYRGINGEDAPGTWRLPTQREAMVMLTIIDQVVNNPDARVTNYIDETEVWTATEFFGSADYWQAWVIDPILSIAIHEVRTSATKKSARCVKDIYFDVNE